MVMVLKGVQAAGSFIRVSCFPGRVWLVLLKILRNFTICINVKF